MAPRQGRLLRVAATAWRAAGVDEAGRGCLAGPVAAAAVILPPAFSLPGLVDSKMLAPRRRELLAAQIRACAVAFAVRAVWPRRIEAVNILNASLEAMAKAAFALRPLPDLLLIDGNQRIRPRIMAMCWPDAPLPKQKTIVRGDSLAPAISAASILAKTWRDDIMRRLDARWPGYGFARHKGYATREHLAALARLGPCSMHRKGFRGVPGQGK